MTQSRKVGRAMPALVAASARFIPDSALAIARIRRVTRGSPSSLASLRNTAGVRSLRILSSFISVPARESSRRRNHKRRPLGIAGRPHESVITIRDIIDLGRTEIERRHILAVDYFFAFELRLTQLGCFVLQPRHRLLHSGLGLCVADARPRALSRGPVAQRPLVKYQETRKRGLARASASGPDPKRTKLPNGIMC